jgi:hypothetical protein
VVPEGARRKVHHLQQRPHSSAREGRNVDVRRARLDGHEERPGRCPGPARRSRGSNATVPRWNARMMPTRVGVRTPTSQPYDLTFRKSYQCHEGPKARVSRVVARMRRPKSSQVINSITFSVRQSVEHPLGRFPANLSVRSHVPHRELTGASGRRGCPRAGRGRFARQGAPRREGVDGEPSCPLSERCCHHGGDASLI